MAKSSAEKTGDESRLSHERIGGDQLTLIDGQRILNGRMGLGGDQTSVNGDQRRISCESGKSDELDPKIGDQRRPGETSQPDLPKDSKDILKDSKDILHSFGECNEEDIETSRSIDSTMYNKRAAVRKYDKEKHAGASGKMMQKSELIERYKTIMSKCIDYIIYSECIYPMTVSETNFICHMLVTMLLSINSVIEKKNNTNYSSIMWNIRHTLRTKTSQLIIWILEPNRSTNLRIFLINTLRNEIYLKEILTNLFVNNNLEIKFILFLWELIYCCKLNNDDLRVCYEFEAKLKSIINHDIGNSNSKLNREVYIACKEFKAAQNEWVLAQMTHINKMILTRYEQLVRQITDTCIASTQQCLHRQNAVQKTLLGEIKAIYNKQLFTKDVWNRIILNLTHEKAPWYCEESYPKSWQLDDVEGPERIRIRQKRCHLYVHEKYLKPEYRAKTAAYKKEQPLEYLVKDSIKHESMIETIHTSESVTYMCCTHLITPSKQIQGELLITSAGLKFIPFNESHNFVTNAVTEEFSEHEQVMSEGKNSEEPNETGAETKRIHNAIDEVDISNDVNSDQKIEVRENLSENAAQNTKVEKLNKKTTTKTKKNVSPDTEGIVYRTDDIISVQFTNIKEIHNRRYNLQEKAIELFLINGKNYLFAFENHNDREHFLNELSTCNLPNRMSSDLLSDTIQLWREGHLTNWA
ncbi:lysosomal-trafficking regulator-like [Diaphorina citri]|uniref:Lysosomal-trafficking regulator-like n=1 Tax=Diaphorina citri TaxID=121845 RepID=A0A3Q0JG62_DIACI|nr:lysosomal-trafficking regulator-like [Diaphorina citri]